jgi:putative ABC transport system substrate-binding protein
VLVLSGDEPEYQAVAAGFRQAFTGPFAAHNLEGSDEQVRIIGQRLQTQKPAVAVVVGDLAAQMAKWYLEGVPIVYCDAVRAAKISLTTGGAVGIYHEPDPDEQIRAIHELFPTKTRIGLLYSPDYAQFNRQEILAKAQGLGLTLEVVPLASIQEVPAKFRELLPKVDLLWVWTDPVVLGAHSIQYIVLQSLSSGLPIFCGDYSLAHRGATAAMVPDFEDAGRQAAKVAGELMKSPARPAKTILYPKGKLILNQKIAGLLKVSFPAASLSQAQELIQ